MKIKFWDRVLIAFGGLLILLAGIGLLVFSLGFFPFKLDVSELQGPFELWQRAVMIAVALLACLLGIHGIYLLFRRGGEKGFIIQHTEYGDMSISMHAMENMVKKCVDSHDELNVNTTRIYRSRAGVVVDVKITLASGVNIPLTVNALQKQIKQYITSCSGVDVQEVRVMVETNVNKQAAQEMPIQEVVVEKCASPEKAAEPAHESFAQRMFKHNETPEQYAAAFQGSTAVEVPQAAPEMNFPMPEEQATPMAEGTAQENDEQKTAEKEKE